MPTHSSLHAGSRFRVAAFAFFLTAALGPATAPAAIAQQPNVVSGTVRTATGRPIAGATIRISGATGAGTGTTVRTQSDRNGNYRITVRPGHYNVDAYADLTFDGQTYRELPLMSTQSSCARQLSQNGIVRNFVLRLSGPLRCAANFDANEPASYAGGMVHVTSGNIPPAARVRFAFTPIGTLADGSRGQVLSFERSGAMLAVGGGRLGQTAWLHDIPLGRYNVTAVATLPGGNTQSLLLRTDGAASPSVEISFPANQMLPYGFRSAALTIDGTSSRRPQPGPQPAPQAGGNPPVTENTATQNAGGLPVGRYDCSYQSEYAGEIPNGRTIVIQQGGRYQAWGSSGNYSRSGSAIRWSSGPFAARGVTVSFAESGDRAVLTVRGGAAAEDPNGTNRCVLSGR
jgi:hypothetical protein